MQGLYQTKEFLEVHELIQSGERPPGKDINTREDCSVFILRARQAHYVVNSYPVKGRSCTHSLWQPLTFRLIRFSLNTGNTRGSPISAMTLHPFPPKISAYHMKKLSSTNVPTQWKAVIEKQHFSNQRRRNINTVVSVKLSTNQTFLVDKKLGPPLLL